MLAPSLNNLAHAFDALPEYRWAMVSLVLGLCFLLWARWRLQGGWSSFDLLTGALGTCAVLGFVARDQATRPNPHLLTLLSGIVCAALIRLLTGEPNRNPERTTNWSAAIRWLCILMPFVLWALAPAVGEFQYRDVRRWTGPFLSPNLFGLSMGVVLILASNATLGTASQYLARTERFPGSNAALLARGMAGLAAAGASLVSLAMSFSRGAWVAVLAASAYLAWTHAPTRAWLSRHRLHLAIASCCALGVLWLAKDTELVPVRRAATILNPFDLSWRNRIATWGQALAAIGDRPLVGHGWDRPGDLFCERYLHPLEAEGQAIQTNSWLILGIVMGLPGVTLLATLMSGIFRDVGTVGNDAVKRSRSSCSSAKSICADRRPAGAVVLLLGIGLFLDGGLGHLGIVLPLFGMLALAYPQQSPGFRWPPHLVRSTPLPWRFALGFSLVLGAAALWQRGLDPFRRTLATLRTPSGMPIRCFAVAPKNRGSVGAVVCFQGKTQSLTSSGKLLRALAEHGLLAVAMTYPTDARAFPEARDAVDRWIATQIGSAPGPAPAWLVCDTAETNTMRHLLQDPTGAPSVYIRPSVIQTEPLGEEWHTAGRSRWSCPVWLFDLDHRVGATSRTPVPVEGPLLASNTPVERIAAVEARVTRLDRSEALTHEIGRRLASHYGLGRRLCLHHWEGSRRLDRELVVYQRRLIPWSYPDEIWRDVLQPDSVGWGTEPSGWRTTLWRVSWPRIRRERNPIDGARLLVRFIRSRVDVDVTHVGSRDTRKVWLDQAGSAESLLRLTIASCRSAGLAARRNEAGNTLEVWDDGTWRTVDY